MKKKRLITSALPYVNNVPHLGNIIGCVLSADVYARYCRAAGYETLYICATDEYGTATENKAREEGLSPKEICDKYHAIHQEIYQYFNISFDFFGRTSHPEHIEVTQAIFSDLDKAGLVLEQETEQTYCEVDQMFLADRYVEGTCPHCGYEGARGDQCDRCGKLLQPTELKNPKCQVCGNPPVLKKTKHLYLDLPSLESRLSEFHQRSSIQGKWAHNAITTTQGWIERGIQPRPITRDLKWGVPVPKAGFQNKVFYVWFDAPTGYISATKSGYPDTWKDWWFDPEGTQLYQFMAKDNIPFHTVVFPASLIGSGQNWTLLHHIASTEYLNYEGGKFSKSRSLGIFGTDLKELDIPIDLWRFYLLFNRPERSDSNFSWDGFLEDINSNFIDNIGNLLNRVLVFYQKNYGQPLDGAIPASQVGFLDQVKELGATALGLMDQVQIKDGLKTILAMGRLGNKYFHDSEPWKGIKEDPEKTKEILVALIYLLHDLGQLLSPYMPQTAEEILGMLGQKKRGLTGLGDWSSLAGAQLPAPAILFQKLEKKRIDSFKDRFSGKRELVEEGPDPFAAWAKVEIKVGKIIHIEPHPEADRLYVEKIDLGEDQPRTLVSGLKAYYSAEELLGRKVLVASNLKPALLRGVWSQGMVLAVEKRKRLEVVDLKEAEIGEVVFLEGESPNRALPEIELDTFFAAQIRVKDHRFEIEGRGLSLAFGPLKSVEISEGKVG